MSGSCCCPRRLSLSDSTSPRRLEQHGISAEVFPAVIGTQPKYDALAQTMLKIPKTFITTRGALGLMLTWQAMVRAGLGSRGGGRGAPGVRRAAGRPPLFLQVADALAKKYKYVLVLEDDINFAHNFEAVMAAAAVRRRAAAAVRGAGPQRCSAHSACRPVPPAAPH